MSFTKNFIIQSGFYDYYRLYSKYIYYLNNHSIEDIPPNIMPYADFGYFVLKYPHLQIRAAKLYASHRGKVKRVRKRIKNMLYDEKGNLKDTLFLTLTFTDDVLESTSQKTRRTYVARFLKSQLKSQKVQYVANIDFGDINGREHYHSIFGDNFVNHSDWPYGNINFKRITKTPEKIGEYINKLTFHSVKDSCGYLIYSRKLVEKPMFQSEFI